MTEKGKKRFMSIRTRLFLQVGFVILIAIAFILVLNNFLLPDIYTRNEKRAMREVYRIIDGISPEDELYSHKINNYERANSLSIDIYQSDGTPLYYGTDELFSQGGKTTFSDYDEDKNGSHFEVLTNETTKSQYLVYFAPLSFGGEIEIYSMKDNIDANANTAILITSTTSVAALLLAVLFIFFYTRKFTKPLIKMSEVTARMSEMDFSQKCEVEGNDALA